MIKILSGLLACLMLSTAYAAMPPQDAGATQIVIEVSPDELEDCRATLRAVLQAPIAVDGGAAPLVLAASDLPPVICVVK